VNHDLGILVFWEKCLRGEYILPEKLSTSQSLRQVFLTPKNPETVEATDIHVIRPAEWGWITVFPGRVSSVRKRKVLLLSQIVGGANGSKRTKCETWLKAVQRRLKMLLHAGVRGTNTETGKSSDYPALLYTDGALEFLGTGGLWTQFPDAKAIFEPSEASP
jgi:hypothetical protein